MENMAEGCWLRCVYFFGGLEGIGHFFTYVAHFVFLRGVWIRTQRAAVASMQARYPSPSSHPSTSRRSVHGRIWQKVVGRALSREDKAPSLCSGWIVGSEPSTSYISKHEYNSNRANSHSRPFPFSLDPILVHGYYFRLSVDIVPITKHWLNGKKVQYMDIQGKNMEIQVKDRDI